MLTPTTVMTWQGFVVLHVAVLPTVLFAATCLRSRRQTIARWVVVGWLAATVVFAAAMAVGSPMYRRGGRSGRAAALHTYHPMLDELGISAHCSVPVDPVNGWWVNALSWPAAAPTPVHR